MEHKLLTRIASGVLLVSAIVILLSGLSAVPALAEPPEPGGNSQPNVDPLVRCEPTSVVATVGDEAVIDLYIQDVTNLYGADLRVSYDPTIGQVVDQDTFTPGIQIQVLYTFLNPFFIIQRSVYGPTSVPPNCGVDCIWYASTQANPTPPATGSGAVVRVTYLGLQTGTFPMNWINTQLSAPGGVPITPVNNQPCSVTFVPPLAVTLESLEAVPESDHVLVRWTTVSEIGNAGFNIYRSEDEAVPGSQLNDTLIPSAAPGSNQGASYQWSDFDVESGVTYYYWLEEVSFSGATELHGPVSATVQTPTAVALSDMRAGPAAGESVLSWLLVVAGALAALVLVGSFKSGRNTATARSDVRP